MFRLSFDGTASEREPTTHCMVASGHETTHQRTTTGTLAGSTDLGLFTQHRSIPLQQLLTLLGFFLLAKRYVWLWISCVESSLKQHGAPPFDQNPLLFLGLP